MPNKANDTTFCSCLNSQTHGGIAYFLIEDVAIRMQEMFPEKNFWELAAESYALIKDDYITATNEMVRETDYFGKLTDDQKAELETYLKTRRCAGCGFRVCMYFRNPENMPVQLEAA